MRNPIRPAGDSEAVWRQTIERRLRALETRAPGGFSGDGETTFLRGGRDLQVVDGDIVIDGGQLLAGPTTVDASGVSITGAPVQLDGDGLDIGSGLVQVDEDGLRVGSDVEIDADGLHVEGGDVRAIDVASDEASDTGVTLTTTMTQRAAFTLNVPSWATAISVICFAVVQSSDGGFGPLGIRASARIDDVNDGEGQSDTDGLATQALHITEKTLTTFGSTIECSVYAGRNSGSGNPTNATVSVRARALFLR